MMSASMPQCTPAEIAEKRRIALGIAEERKKQNRLKRRLEQNNENRLSLNRNNSEQSTSNTTKIGTSSSTSEPTSGLTDQQKAAIEFNRQEAIKNLLSKKFISNRAATELLSKNVHQVPSPLATSSNAAKLNSVQVKSSNQSLGKSVAPSRTQVIEARKKPYQQQLPSYGKRISVNCKVEFITEDRFEVRMDNFNETIVNEFKKVSSKAFNQNTKKWSFHISEYEKLVKLIVDAGNEKLAVAIEKIPEFSMKFLKDNTTGINEACLSALEPELLEKLYDYQKTAVAFGINKGGRFLIGDDMGLGKTREALAVAKFYENDWPLLIVTTASSRSVWSNEIMAFMPDINVYDIRALESCNDYILDAKIVICSYAALENNMEKLEQKNFGVIIFDESHALKNNHAKQTVNATKLGQKAKRAILVSGTPALSSPVELYTQLNIIKKNFASYTAFTTRYCDGRKERFAWMANGCTNPKELEVILRKHFMIRRLKSDVYGCLEGKTREKVELARCSMDDFAQDYSKAVERNNKPQEVLIQWYVSTAEKKKNDVCQYIQAALKQTDEKILIFAAHHCVLDAISDSLASNGVRFVRIDGKTNAKTRAENVANFQNDQNIRCAILSIHATKEGITLTSASIVIFAELDWTPSNILQAEGRAHRIGQTRPVKVYYLISPGTADDVMWRKLEEKQFHLSSLGLGAKNDRLKENTSTTFRTTAAVASSSTPSKRITDFFVTDGTPTRSDTPEIFYSCETSKNVEIPASRLTEAKAQLSPKNLSDQFLDAEEDCEIDLQALIEVEEKAKAGNLVSTSKASSSKEVLKLDNLNQSTSMKPTILKSLSQEDSEIDLLALMEIENNVINSRKKEKPSATQRLIQSELEGVCFDDEDDELLASILNENMKKTAM